ncbi:MULTISPECIES: helix-turn-helix domain-containing protein [unclassified Shinella]|uniref:helix-turn-helix domain-containing protein n=1 Tax=unclassified Shinella TaxID=2643062 RepID=UPI00234F7718|nr:MULTISPECIES: helix-turn-helix domain-containing protein [unclassified Shinella]MCO5148778.1 helix-turn-helix domain-containing protein [Shinella sp.]MDC7264839.1 helix-turn-helix domain-containing protein [Shinella sp. HY16]MDC7271736.1 helix-turn-helix domain-containing protein [Shinella sp. YZ44]
MAQHASEFLLEIGQLLMATRKGRQLTQEQVANMAGVSRPRYREIEAGSSAAPTTTLINIARALGLELMLVPQAMVPAVDALLRPQDDIDDLPAFLAHPDEDENV